MGLTEVTKRKTIDILFSAIDEINQGLPAKARLEKSLSAALVGDEGRLDSLGFVNLILSVEEMLSEEFGPLSLAEAIVADNQANPPKTLGALAGLVITLMEKNLYE